MRRSLSTKLCLPALLFVFSNLVNAQIIRTVAGSGTTGFYGDGGPATSARFYNPTGIAIDKLGNIYTADWGNNRIRMVNTSSVINTVAGSSTSGYSGDGAAATSAGLYYPCGVAVDTAGNIYIADYYNNRVRKVTASTGKISTIAGTNYPGYSGDGGAATSAQLNNPFNVTVDAQNNVYIADKNNNCIRKITALTGIITTVAGTGIVGYTGDGAAATSATLNGPNGITVDAAGNLYISDTFNHCIRKVSASTGFISTIAGDGASGFAGDGLMATSSKLYLPNGTVVDALGNVYISDTYNNRIRKITASSGIINTIVGDGTAAFSGDGSAASSAQVNKPFSLALDASGNLFFSDYGNYRIRKIALISSINEIDFSKRMNIFPVPNNGDMTLSLEGNGYFALNIYNSLGQVVFEKSLNTLEQYQDLNINLNNVSNGIYSVRVLSEKGTVNKLITIQK